MQSCFKESDDREAVTILASNIVNTQEATYSDNGTTQQAVMKTGITTKDNVLVPNPVNLIPYRTFLEVEQPASDFVFRIGEGRGGAPVFKLVAADGGLWKSQAVEIFQNSTDFPWESLRVFSCCMYSNRPAVFGRPASCLIFFYAAGYERSPRLPYGDSFHIFTSLIKSICFLCFSLLSFALTCF